MSAGKTSVGAGEEGTDSSPPKPLDGEGNSGTPVVEGGEVGGGRGRSVQVGDPHQKPRSYLMLVLAGLLSSGVTSKAASRGHLKSGQ
jgi:hypothetical protein